MFLRVSITLVLVFTSAEWSEAKKPDRVRELQRVMTRLRPLHTPLGKPKPGDWLASHKEQGQTFRQYLKARPVTPTGRRKLIYVQPLGDFNEKQREIVTLTTEFLSIWYNRPVRVRKDLPLKIIPKSARRKHPEWGDRQILTTYGLQRVLKPRLPKNAAAMIALTSSDLWPGDGWNFLFGQAAFRDRVGVWSIYRNGDPNGGEEEYRKCLVRTIRIATHEMGHMFTMYHCTAYECNMCGCNSLAESDRRPLALCPECLAKTCWATGADPVERYEKLIEFCKKHGLKPQQTFFEKLHAALEE